MARFTLRRYAVEPIDSTSRVIGRINSCGPLMELFEIDGAEDAFDIAADMMQSHPGSIWTLDDNLMHQTYRVMAS